MITLCVTVTKLKREVTYDTASRLFTCIRTSFCHWPGGRGHAAQRHPRAVRHRIDAERGEPEFHRVLALWSASRGVDGHDGRDFLHRHRGGGSGGGPGAHHCDL